MNDTRLNIKIELPKIIFTMLDLEFNINGLEVSYIDQAKNLELNK